VNSLKKRGLRLKRLTISLQRKTLLIFVFLLPVQTKRTKGRFTDRQREILLFAWNRGYLCDNTNYGSLSVITALTRKQISNWARARIHNSGKEHLPQKNDAPLETIFKELRENFPSWQPNLITEHSLEGARQYFRQEDEQNIQGRTTALRTMFPAPDLYSSSFAGDLLFSGSNVIPQTIENVVRFELCSRNMRKSFEQCTPKIEINPYVLQIALKGINLLSDQKIESLSVLSGFSIHNIREYLINKGWRAIPTARGLQYMRSSSAAGSSNRFVSLINEETPCPCMNSRAEDDKSKVFNLEIS